MIRNNLFIVLEGLSGVGKTTVGKLLAIRLNGIYYKTPPYPFPYPFDLIRGHVDQNCGLKARFLFYLSSVIYASAEIKELLKHSPVVCDRYILTTICFHRAAGLSLEINYSKPGLAIPDLTVFLTCGEEKRFSRLDSRGWSPNDRWEEIDTLSEKFEAEYRKHQIFEVSTDFLNPQGMAEYIVPILKKRAELVEVERFLRLKRFKTTENKGEIQNRI